MRFLSCCLIVLAALLSHAPVYAQKASSETLEQLAIYPKRSASATALSLNNSTLSSQLSAKVLDIPVRVSQSVKKGEVLLNLDCADYRLALDMAQASVEADVARLELAESQLIRSKRLLAKALDSQQQTDIRTAEAIAQRAVLKQQKIALRQAELNVSRCKITAPFDGIVSARLVAEGQLANVGTPLLSLVDTTNLELAADVSYSDAEWFDGIQSFTFDYGKQLSVRLHNIGGVIDPQTRNREIRFTFAGEKPLPGTAGKLIWADPRPFVPARFVVQRGGLLGVFTDEKGIARFNVLSHAAPGRPVAVSWPLDTRLVTSELGSLTDGESL